MLSTIERARDGDPIARVNLVKKLKPRLARMASYYARRTGEDADDLLQEAWFGLLDALPRLDPTIGSPEQYLLQRARWRLLDAVRRGHARRWEPLEDHDELPHPAPGQSEVPIEDFAQRLNSTQRAILGHLLAGHTWREIGAALGCTSANVAYHVRQIKRQYTLWEAEPAAELSA